MVLIYALLATGIGLTVLRLMMLMFLRINIPMFNVQVLKLLKANDVKRAIKLCNAVPKCVYAVVIRNMLERAQKMGDEIAQPSAAQTLRTGFIDNLETEVAKLRKSDWLASLGVLLAVTGAALSLGVDNAPLAPLLGPVMALGVAYNARTIVKQQLSEGKEAGSKVIDAYIEEATRKAT